ncbi:MAG: LpxD N-terminal domain-containing protein [Crocinitomicaceae bacterium]|jgi:UDP-3-O-[3-hydroxymyristoyl] glucosamine N-acyltransferase|tara:strand:+ start:5231 stop:6148 length:918 start_codon:yes stop_codon:yes gene_type:complete
MRFSSPKYIEDIAAHLKREFAGPKAHKVLGLSEINQVEKGDLIFVDHPKYFQKALLSNANTILINEKIDPPEGKAIIISDHPFDDYNQLTQFYFPKSPLGANMNQTINHTATIAQNATIGNHVQIGKGVVILPGAVIMDYVEIGDHVIIGPNSVIGHDAFYYNTKKRIHTRMNSIGGVKIEDHVEIGASCTIDRGVSSMTTIGQGTKIDNLVQIGHDTVIGKDCLIASGAGIAGCVTIKDHVTIWGQVGCASKVTIGENVVVFAQSGISKDLETGKSYFGSPCIEATKKFRELAALRNLPKFLNK